MEKFFYTIPEAAKLCFVARQTMWRWIKCGELKGFLTPGGNYRIRKEDLESFIQKKMKYLPVADLLQRKKILIVNGDPKILKMFRKMLPGNGFRVETALGGFEAGVKIMQYEPDLIILDLHMPGMDGFDVCDQIKKNPKTAHSKIIVYTEFDTQDNRDRVMKAGADGYMIKPVSKPLLIQNIETLIR